MKTEDFLRKVDLFSSLSQRHLKGLAGFCKERSYAAGQSLVTQGEEGAGMFLIVSGKVKVVKRNESGQSFEIATHGPGEFIGEMAVIDGAPRTASVVATEDTVCLVLVSWDFNAFMKAHPEIALEILPVVVKRFRETNEKLTGMGRSR
jgi:CRP-like cAMP-binding protein